MTREIGLIAAAVVGLSMAAGLGGQEPAPNRLTADEARAGWQLLFDGETTAGWRGFRAASMPDGWQAEGGALVRVGPGGDIVTVDQFDDFELTLEWRIGAGGNSGIFFRVSEASELVWHSAPELQVLDDAAHADGASALTSAGSNYALHGPEVDVVRPVGAWNEVRLVVDGAHVEHWMNGEKIVEYELWSDDWQARVAASKFAAYPEYGQAPRGHIALQDHGDRVEFRNIKIRSLPSDPTTVG